VKTLTAAALTDGILDAASLQIYEQRFRAADARSEKWLTHHAEKIARELAAFAAAPPTGHRDVAHIGLACALGYLDLRFNGAWRGEHPSLVAWLDAFAAGVPAFAATRIKA
jgi:glutathione S-transferase